MYCSPARQVALLRIVMTLYRRGREMIQAGAPLAELRALAVVPEIMRAKSTYGNDEADALQEFESRVNEALDAFERKYARQR